MKLSIVIPAYNEETYIAQCLESVLREIKNVSEETELIVVNNASTDETKKIALDYPNITVVDEPKKGLTQARHAGFIVSNGDLIANIDADTKMPAGWIKKVFDEFEKDKNLVALSGPYIYYDLPPIVRFFVKIFYIIGFATYLFNHFVLKKGAMLQGGNFVVRRNALLKIGGFDTNINFYGEDTDIARRIQKIGKVKFTFKLPMYTTGRRLKREGVLVSGLRYTLNYFWILIFKKPFSKKYSDIRIEK